MMSHLHLPCLDSQPASASVASLQSDATFDPRSLQVDDHLRPISKNKIVSVELMESRHCSS